jgi:nitrate/TMAO reductase-like tetraheme cytochrome c subunit
MKNTMCPGCNREVELTNKGWRPIKLTKTGECRACNEANAEAEASQWSYAAYTDAHCSQ